MLSEKPLITSLVTFTGFITTINIIGMCTLDFAALRGSAGQCFSEYNTAYFTHCYTLIYNL